jgi:hypothetical protein
MQLVLNFIKTLTGECLFTAPILAACHFLLSAVESIAQPTALFKDRQEYIRDAGPPVFIFSRVSWYCLGHLKYV